MHVSLFEIWKITQRCLEAAGVPAGHDREGAFATMWLAEHGFPSMEMVDETDLSRGADWALALNRTSEGIQLDAGGLPLVSLAIDAVDLAVADASQNLTKEPVTFTILNACAPLYLVPFAARRAQQEGMFSLHWHTADDEFRITVVGDGIWIDGSRLDGLNDVTSSYTFMLSYVADGNRDGSRAARLLTPNQLSTRRKERLSAGVEVEESRWSRMVQMSRAVLVPDSAASRAHGAGGGNAND